MSEDSSLLDVNVVSPSGQILSLETDAVIAPGELGEFEVMPGHVPFLSGLHPGVLRLGEKGEVHTFAVSRGYLQVDGRGGVEILVEKAIAADDVDVDAANKQLEEANDAIKAWDGDADGSWQTLKDRLDWAQAQLDCAGKRAN